MKERARYILVCAGEDSGDSIGESLVKAIVADARFEAVGAGGIRMQNAGLRSLVEYETLPVSGFGDVVPRYFKLRQSFNQLKTALESPNCVGLIAIDYPGFNMKLVALAGKLRKPALYVAPPQVWAWKRKRAKELAKNPFIVKNHSPSRKSQVTGSAKFADLFENSARCSECSCDSSSSKVGACF